MKEYENEEYELINCITRTRIIVFMYNFHFLLQLLLLLLLLLPCAPRGRD